MNGKKFISLILSISLLLMTACGKIPENSSIAETVLVSSDSATIPEATTVLPSEEAPLPEETISPYTEISEPVQQDTVKAENLNFFGLDDPNLLQYVNDTVYSNLECNFSEDNFVINDVSSVYRSKEYLDNLAANSQENMYFGYTLSEVEQQFHGEKYVFTVDENGQTIVKALEKYDNTCDEIVRNVAIGTGVIFIRITVSATKIGKIILFLATSAEKVNSFVDSLNTISDISQHLITTQTEDTPKNDTNFALEASEEFMWAALRGKLL